MILIAVEKNGYVYTYSKERKLLFTKRGELYNYNENVVAIQRADNKDIIEVYDVNGNLIFTYPYDLEDLDNIRGQIL